MERGDTVREVVGWGGLIWNEEQWGGEGVGAMRWVVLGYTGSGGMRWGGPRWDGVEWRGVAWRRVGWGFGGVGVGRGGAGWGLIGVGQAGGWGRMVCGGVRWCTLVCGAVGSENAEWNGFKDGLDRVGWMDRVGCSEVRRDDIRWVRWVRSGWGGIRQVAMGWSGMREYRRWCGVVWYGVVRCGVGWVGLGWCRLVWVGVV